MAFTVPVMTRRREMHASWHSVGTVKYLCGTPDLFWVCPLSRRLQNG